ncbi:MAG: XdhC family protein [Flavobacteriales bacterium]|nr:XdhC family protein [Flavobacteriales bacterium]
MNNRSDFWQQVLTALEAGEQCILLHVVESRGSSPGRAGFRMAVTSGGALLGTIGGGSMEHKLVELARNLMDQPEKLPFLKRQVHRSEEPRDRSGMICSGEQTVAFHSIEIDALSDAMERLASGTVIEVLLTSTGLRFESGGTTVPDTSEPWSYRLPMNAPPRIAIVGGGHVGLALSRTMHQLGFHVMQFDHREDLNTMSANAWAHERQVVDFARIDELIPDDPELYVALVSHGYRTDEVALRRLLRRRWKYLGMLGSKAKVEAMFAAMRADGFTQEELSRVHSPIGLPINSHTAEEIAVSIAAQIIGVKNAPL